MIWCSEAELERRFGHKLGTLETRWWPPRLSAGPDAGARICPLSPGACGRCGPRHPPDRGSGAQSRFPRCRGACRDHCRSRPAWPGYRLLFRYSSATRSGAASIPSRLGRHDRCAEPAVFQRHHARAGLARLRPRPRPTACRRSSLSSSSRRPAFPDPAARASCAARRSETKTRCACFRLDYLLPFESACIGSAATSRATWGITPTIFVKSSPRLRRQSTTTRLASFSPRTHSALETCSLHHRSAGSQYHHPAAARKNVATRFAVYFIPTS